MRRVKAVVRGAAALILFGLFGLGGIALSPLMIVLRSPRRCQPVVRALWIPLVALFKMFGIISVTADKSLRSLRGCVVAANHPSRIDVVLITALVPRTLFVAKASLLRNPFMAAVVRNTSLPVDEHLPEEAVSYLAEGWNILIFPESHETHNNIVYKLQNRFVDLAKMYHNSTGKKIKFVPLYISPKLGAMYFGKPTEYCPENDIKEERERVCRYLSDTITDIAVGLPKHKVVPYSNIPKKKYLTNKDVTEVPE